MFKNKVNLIECPRDAMQGWKHFIPTQLKIRYINALLDVGFHTIDFGSFVSSKVIPQMADTKEVIKGLRINRTTTKLLSIVANKRGAEDAVGYDQISCLGYPFSISPTFQLRNTNFTIPESVKIVEEIQNLCIKTKKTLVVYLSMGFGNPYGDAYNEEILFGWMDKITQMGINIISIADTTGIASPAQVSSVMGKIIPFYPDKEIGVHLHSAPFNWKTKIDAALTAGCMRFDGALHGVGGCPMAGDEMVGNLDSELMIPYFNELGILNNLNMDALSVASRVATEIFDTGTIIIR